MEPAQPIPVSLTPEQRRFVQQQLDAGRYASAEEVLLQGLRQLEDQEEFIAANREEFRRKIEEGEAAADRGELVDGEAVMDAWRQEDAAARRRQQEQPRRRA